MALDLQLNALLVPEGTEFPGTVQDFLQMLEEYLEITGGADFNGVNYGVAEPSPEDRDKAWFRTDLSGNFLGWFGWDGGAWTILPTMALVGTLAERDALTNVQQGTLFHLAGTGLYVYDGANWEAGFPAPIAPETYDRHYFLESYQQLVNATTAVGTWTELDLADEIAAAGISAPKAVMVAVECGFTQTGFASGPNNFNVTLRVTQDSGVSTSSNTLLKASAQATQDDDRVSGQAQSFGIIPLPNGQNEIYYSVSIDGAPPGVFAKVYLTGFIY